MRSSQGRPDQLNFRSPAVGEARIVFQISTRTAHPNSLYTPHSCSTATHCLLSRLPARKLTAQSLHIPPNVRGGINCDQISGRQTERGVCLCVCVFVGQAAMATNNDNNEMHSFSARLNTFHIPHQLSKRRASSQSIKKKVGGGGNTLEWPHERPSAEDVCCCFFLFINTPPHHTICTIAASTSVFISIPTDMILNDLARPRRFLLRPRTRKPR